jgi:hypothetical protein
MAGEIGSRREVLSTHGMFTVTFDAPGVTPDNNVVASITEVDGLLGMGIPIVGDAVMTIHNVAPYEDRIIVRGTVNWHTDLWVRVTVMHQ